MEADDTLAIGAIKASIRRRWPVIALVVIIAVGAALAASAHRHRSYESVGKLLLVPLAQYDQTYFATDLFRDAGDATLTAASAAETLHSQDIGAAAARQRGDGTTASGILAGVAVTPTLQTNVLRVVATADSPAAAVRMDRDYLSAILAVRWRDVAQSVRHRIAVLTALRAGPSQIQPLTEVLRGGADPTIEVAQSAAPATSASQLPAAAIVILALLGGLFLGLVAAFTADRLGGRVRDELDARHAIDVAVWERVPALPRRLRGRGPVAPSQQPEQVRDAYRAVAEHLSRRHAAGATIAIVSPAGGDGRTTTAVSVARALGERGYQTALVLLDSVPDETLMGDLAHAGVEVFDAAGTPAGRLNGALTRAGAATEMVVLDGPSLHRGVDLVISAEDTELLVVVRANHTTRHDLARAGEALAKSGRQPLGMVLLGAEPTRQRRRPASGNGRRAAP